MEPSNPLRSRFTNRRNGKFGWACAHIRSSIASLNYRQCRERQHRIVLRCRAAHRDRWAVVVVDRPSWTVIVSVIERHPTDRIYCSICAAISNRGRPYRRATVTVSWWITTAFHPDQSRPVQAVQAVHAVQTTNNRIQTTAARPRYPIGFSTASPIVHAAISTLRRRLTGHHQTSASLCNVALSGLLPNVANVTATE